MLIATLDAAVGIAQENLYTLLATQLLLIRFLHTLLADVVASLVVVIVLNIGLRDLCHIAQDVGCIGILVLADAALLHIETGEAEHLLPEHTELLVRELRQEQLLSEPRVAGVLAAVLDIVHTTDEELLGDTQRLAELEGIDVTLLFVHHHHDVIGRLVVDQQIAVAIVDDTTRGIVYLLEESVTVGIALVVIAHQLQREEADDVYHDNDDCHASDDEAPVLQIEVFHLQLPCVFDYQYQHRGEDGARQRAGQPLGPVVEAERLQGKEYEAVDGHHYQSVIEEARRAQVYHRGSHILLSLTAQQRHEDVGADKANQSHADGGYSRRVGEYVYDDAHDKGNEQQCPSGAVTLKEHDKIDIEQGRGDTEEMDMIKYQYLHQQYHRV